MPKADPQQALRDATDKADAEREARLLLEDKEEGTSQQRALTNGTPEEAAKRAPASAVKAPGVPVNKPTPEAKTPVEPTLYRVFVLRSLAAEGAGPDDPNYGATAWQEQIEMRAHSRERAVLALWESMVEDAMRTASPEQAIADLQGTQLVAVADSNFRPVTPKAEFDLRLSL